MADGDVYIATETFAAEIDGVPQIVHKDKTRVRAGHALLDSVPQFFKRAGDDVQFDVETATAEPGEQRKAPPRSTAGAGKS